MTLEQVRERLSRLIESTHGEVQLQLRRKLRIFCGVNAPAFALLALITFKRHASTLQLLLPALALIGAAAATAVAGRRLGREGRRC